MERGANEVTAGGERSVGAGGNVGAAATGDHSTATYIENQYVQQAPGTMDLTSEEIAEALRRYATRIRETYGRLDLEVLIPTEEGEHPPVGLKEVFVPPVVRSNPPPVELPRDIRQRLVEAGEWPSSLPPGLERDALDRARQEYAERPARDVLEVLADPNASRLVLLGDPGAGKSTLARCLALVLTGAMPADHPLEALAGRVPLVVELREYAAAGWRDRTFEEFLRHLHTTKGMAPPYAVVERVLAEGRAVVVFDGLDELFDPAARKEVSHRIADFAGRYAEAGVRVVVTSRVIGYLHGVLERAGFEHFKVEDLDEGRIDEFARRWYGAACAQDGELAERLYRRLTGAVSQSRSLQGLAGNPLLLTILAIVGRRRELPRDRQGVYRHAVSVLVAHWDQQAKNLHTPEDVEALSYLGDEDRQELLCLVARRIQEGVDGIEGNYIHQDELLTTFKEYLREQYELPVAQAVVAARTMVRQLRERNFIIGHYGAGTYAFVHRTFLEYLAAEDIGRRYTRQREWTPDELIEEVFLRRATDPAWHEVLLLLVGQLGEREAGAAIDGLLELHRRRGGSDVPLLVLAVRALGEVRRIGALAAQSRALVDALIGFSQGVGVQPVLDRRVEEITFAVGALPVHWSGRDRFLRWFHLMGQFEQHNELPSRLACSFYRSPELLRVMRRVTATGMSRGGLSRGLPEFGEEVRGSLRSDEPFFREHGLRRAEHLLGEDDVRALIRDCSQNDPSILARTLALSLRNRYESVESDAWQPVFEAAASGLDRDEREAVLGALANHRGDDPRTWELLYRAAEDPDQRVRRIALDGLFAVRSSGDHAWPLIRHLAVSDPIDDIRGRAVHYLATRPDEWQVVRGLVTDERSGMRSVALGALVAMRGDEPDTWGLVRQRAVEDPDESLRATACVLLGRRKDGEAGTEDFLHSRIAEDPGGVAREYALLALLENYGENSSSWEAARRTAFEDPDPRVRWTALSVLCLHRSDDNGSWAMVFDRLTTDEQPSTRRAALLLIRQHQGDEEFLWGLIRERARIDIDSDVRLTALVLLATDRGDDPLTPDTLRHCAIADLSPRNRVTALRWWAIHQKDDLGAEVLRDRAVGDPDTEVRTAAFQSLAYGWPAHPATIPLLRELADAEEDWHARRDIEDALQAAEALAPYADQLP
ncbi:HEAT repeat domain-containing protein [Streptomyces sp. NPDC057257]|uniref:NACHT domain-containing protein n=1 Tax=Streptomyces sp. NPDC057257 TaxID=3346071 RepID=UPI003643ADA9